MAENVLKFDVSAKTYKKLADKRLDEDDLEGALSLLLEAKGKTKYVLSIYFDIAEIYYEMELYDYSLKYWFRCLDRAPKYDYEDIYNGIGACYYNLNNYTAATYYFNQQFLVSKDGNMYLDDDIIDSVSKMMNPSEGFKVVYPPEEADYEDVMRRAKTLMMRGDTEEACALYLSVPEGAAEYENAQLEASVGEFLEGKSEQAIARSRAIYEKDEKNVFALCNLASMYNYNGAEMLSGLYFSKIKEENAANDDELYKIATACMEHKKYERAAACFKTLLADRPYDMQLLFLYGISLYNGGDFAAAKEVFGRILRITEVNPSALSCYRRADRMLAGNVKNFRPLPDFVRPFDDEEEENTRRMAQLLKIRSDKALKKEMRDKSFWDLVDWGFCAGDKEMARCACYLLAICDTKKADEYLLDKLLDPTLPDEMKAYICELLALKTFDKTVGIVVSNIYKKITFYPLYTDRGARGEIFASAYAACFARCATTGDYDLRKIYDSAADLYYDEDTYGKEYAGKELEALIFLHSGAETVVSIEECALFFGCDEKKLRKLLEKTEKKL